MKLAVKNIKGDGVGEIEIADELMVVEKGDQAVFEAVVGARANARSGTASTKTKAEVKATGAKPWKQKGLGRARAGYRSSPIWRGGGVAFGPKPRSYRKKMNRKVAQLAFARAFSAQAAEGKVVVLENLALTAPKTKEFAGVMKSLGIERNALFITSADNQTLVRASRNIPSAEVVTADVVNTYQLLKYPQIFVTKDAVETLAGRLA